MTDSRIFRVVSLAAALWSAWVGLACGSPQISDKAVMKEMNIARAEPLKYAEYIKEFRKNFEGKFLRLPGMVNVIETNEGVAAVDEAINFLTRQKPLAPLAWSLNLAAAAADLAQEQAKSGATGHNGLKSGGILARAKRHQVKGKMIGENIAYGPNSARAMVMQLLIDDGVPNRSHRKNQFNPHFDMVGVFCGAHPRYETMCVMDFAVRRGSKE